MKLEKLITILNKQESNLRTLLKIVNDKKEALLNNSFEALNKVIADEEKALLIVQTSEEERLLEMQKLFKEYQIDEERYKIQFLLEGITGHVNQDMIDRISNYELRIKEIIGEVSRINHLNMVLIQQSKSLINQTIQAIVNSGKRSMFDRKG